MYRGLARLLLLLLPVCCCAPEALASEAPASETIRLRSGRELTVASIRVLADRLNVSVEADGAVSRVDLPFARVEPRSLLRILDARRDPGDAQAWLRSARVAFAAGLHDQAALRFVRAARLEASLASARNEGLAAIRRAEAQAGLEDLEQRLRAGRDPRLASLLADAILDSAYTAELTAAERRQVEALGALARRLVQRDLERFESQQEAAQAKKAAAAKDAPAKDAPAKGAPASLPKAVAGGVQGGAADSPPDGPGEAPGEGLPETSADELAALRAQRAKAIHAREIAADPSVSLDEALRHLEVAARELLDARRGAQRVRVEDLKHEGARELEDLQLELRELLIGTYLELADLYRQQGRFEPARACVRAVLILEPGNENAWSQRHLIEDDLREASEQIRDPYRYTIRSAAFFGWWSPSPYYGACLPLGGVPHMRAGPFVGRRGVGFGYRTRAVPYRRVSGRRVSGRRR